MEFKLACLEHSLAGQMLALHLAISISLTEQEVDISISHWKDICLGYNWSRRTVTIMRLTYLLCTRCRSHRPLQQDHSTHTHLFNDPLSGTTRVSQYQKGKTSLDFTQARDSEWQWNPLGHMQVYTSLQTDNHTSTSLLSFLQAGCPSCHPANSVKALKAKQDHNTEGNINWL